MHWFGGLGLLLLWLFLLWWFRSHYWLLKYPDFLNCDIRSHLSLADLSGLEDVRIRAVDIITLEWNGLWSNFNLLLNLHGLKEPAILVIFTRAAAGRTT